MVDREQMLAFILTDWLFFFRLEIPQQNGDLDSCGISFRARRAKREKER